MLVPFFCAIKWVLGESVEKAASPPAPLRMERGVVCEVTPIGPLTYLIEFLPSQRIFLSLTELTDLTEHFNQRFELTKRLRHTDITEAFQLRLAVTFCEIG